MSRRRGKSTSQHQMLIIRLQDDAVDCIQMPDPLSVKVGRNRHEVPLQSLS